MSLLAGIARTAIVAGTATAVSNRVSRRQAERWGMEGQYEEPMQQQYAPPPPPPPPARDVIQELKDLAALKEQGILSDEEFAAQKARILA